jgi:hypothetical protein
LWLRIETATPDRCAARPPAESARPRRIQPRPRASRRAAARATARRARIVTAPFHTALRMSSLVEATAR